MRTEDMQIVYTRGNAVERAQQFGEACREAVPAYSEMTAGAADIFSSPRGQALKKSLLENFYSLDPPMDVLEGFCDAAGVSLDVLVERAAAVSAGKSKPDLECSGALLKKDGLVLLGQNLDTGTECAEVNFMEIGHEADGSHGYARFCWPSPLSHMQGINIHGVANGGASAPPNDPMGVGYGHALLLIRWLPFYRCHDVAEVAGAVSQYPMIGKGTNNVWADPDGGMLGTEQGGGSVGIYYPTKNWAAATGFRVHVQGEQLGKHDTQEKANAEHNRWLRFNELLEEAANTPGDPVEQMKRIMADGKIVDGHPASAPCRHAGKQYEGTQFSWIYDVTNRVVNYCGDPSINEWRQIAL